MKERALLIFAHVIGGLVVSPVCAWKDTVLAID